MSETEPVKVFLHIKHSETGETRILEREAPTYEEAHQALATEVPDGWFKLHWMTDALKDLKPLSDRY